MMPAKKNNPKYQTKKGQLKPEEKVLKAHLIKDVNVVEFKVYVVRHGKEEETFGGGAVKKEDLTRVAMELSEFAHQLELSEAEEKGYRHAIDERENEDQNQDNNDDQNEDDLNDDENEQQDDDQEQDQEDDE
jgi:hypothetical protein